MSDERLSYCRLCWKACPVVVTVEGGRVGRVTGNRDNELFGGYTCVKGR